MLWLIYVAVGIPVVALLGLVYFTWRPDYPGSPPYIQKGLPIFGPLKAWRDDPLNLMLEGKRKHGKAFRINMLAKDGVVFTDPSVIHQLTKAPEEMLAFRTGAASSYFIAMIGRKVAIEDMAVCYDATIEALMKGLLPKWLNGFAEMIQKRCFQLLKEQVDKNPTFDLVPFGERLATLCEFECMTGSEFADQHWDLLEEYADIMTEVEASLLNPQSMFFPDSNLMPNNLRLRALHKRLVKVYDVMINTPTKTTSYMHIWTEAFKVAREKRNLDITDEVARGQSIMQFLALSVGARTNAAFQFLWLMIETLNNKRWDEMVQEFKMKMPVKDKPAWVMEDFKVLDFTEQCYKETLRIHSMTALSRFVTEDMEVEGIQLKKDQLVMLGASVNSMDPDIFPDPWKFDPSRWANNVNYGAAYLPFGAGVHKCLGMGFANMVVKSMMTVIFEHFEVTDGGDPLPGRGPNPALGTLCPVGRYNITLKLK